MSNSREQIGQDRRWVNVDGKWQKKQMSRAERRQAKKDPEDAPKKRLYKGYVG